MAVIGAVLVTADPALMLHKQARTTSDDGNRRAATALFCGLSRTSTNARKSKRGTGEIPPMTSETGQIRRFYVFG
jgi:hypothetical protein